MTNALAFGTLAHDGDIRLTAGTTITGGTLTSRIGSLDLTAGGDVAVSNLAAGNSATVRSGGAIRLGALNVGTDTANPANDGTGRFGSIGLFSAADLTLADASATGSIGLGSTAGSVTAGNLGAGPGGGIAVLGAGTIALGTLSAPRLIAIGGPDALFGLGTRYTTADVLAALGDGGLFASGGAVTTGAITSGSAVLVAGTTLDIGTLTASQGDGAALFATGAITTRDIAAAGPIAIQSSDATITTGTLTTGTGDIGLTAGTDIAVGTISAGGAVIARAGGAARFAGVTAGTDSAAGEGGAGSGSIGLFATGDLTLDNTSARGSIALFSGTGTLRAGDLAAGPAGSVAALGGGAITLGAVTTPRLFYVSGPAAIARLTRASDRRAFAAGLASSAPPPPVQSGIGADEVIAALGTAGAVPSGGDVTIGRVDSGTAMIAAGGALTIADTLTARTGGALLLAQNAITTRGMSAAGSLGARSAAGAVTTGNLVAGTPGVGGAIMLMAGGGALTTGTLDAIAGIGAASGTAAVSTGDIESVGGLVRVSAAGDLAVGNVRAAGSIALAGTGAITAGNLTAGTGRQLGPGSTAPIGVVSGSSGGTGGGLAPAGIAAGFDQFALTRCDDCNTDSVALPFTVNYFGTTYRDTFVSSNGYLTFGEGQSSFTPEGLGSGYSGLPIVAAFFADIDTTSAPSTQITYGTGTYAGRQAFAANYNGVGYYDENYDKLNRFQIVLTDRSDTGTGNFDIYYNYGAIAWETGDVDDGVNGFGGNSAAVGYNAGTGNQPGSFFSQPGSQVPGSFLDNGTMPLVLATNNGNPGQLQFSVRNGQVVGGELAVPAAITVTNLAAGNTAAIRLGNLSGETVEVQGAGDVTVGSVTTGDRQSGGAPGALPFAIALDAAGGLIAGDIAGGGLVALGGRDVSAGAIGAPGSVAVLADGVVALGQVTAGQGASDTVFIANRSTLPTGFSFATLLGGSGFDPATLAAATPTRIGGALTLGGPIGAGNLRAAATGPIAIGGAAVTQTILLDTAAGLSANGTIDGGTIAVSSAGLTLAQGAQIGSGRTGTLALANTGTGTTFLGDGTGAGAGDYALSAATLSALHAGTISIAAPGDAVLGTLALTGAGVGTAANLVGDAGRFAVTAGNDIRLLGALAFSQLGAGNSVGLTARNTITGTLPNASVALSGRGTALAGTLSMQADSIRFGTGDALAGIATASLADAETRLAAPATGAAAGGYLRADTVRFAVSGDLMTQNGGTSAAIADRAGVTAGAGGIGIFGISTQQAAIRLILNARLDNAGVLTTGADVVRPVRAAAGRGTNFADGSTINGCLLSATTCGTTGGGDGDGGQPVRDAVARLIPQVRDVVENIVGLPVDIIPASAFTFATPSLVSLVDLAPLSVAPLIDEPVTGAGNDDLWVGVGVGAERENKPVGGEKPVGIRP